MNIGGGRIRGALFNFFVVKKYLFCIFRTLPSVSKITPANIPKNQNFKKKKKKENSGDVILHMCTKNYD